MIDDPGKKGIKVMDYGIGREVEAGVNEGV